MLFIKQLVTATFVFVLVNSTVIIKNVNAQMIPDELQDHELVELPLAQEEDFGLWCRDILLRMRVAQAQARTVYAFGKHEDALNIFDRALASYLTLPTAFYGNSMTYRLIVRARNILQILRRYATSDRDIRTIAVFMDAMVDTIFTTADSLDIPYFTPHNRCNRRCLRNYMQQAEELVLNTAFSQVDLALNNFYQEYSGRVTPIGSTKIVLKVTQLLVEGAIQDLENILSAQYYACTIVDLQRIQSELYMYNSSPRHSPHILGPVHAVSYFYYQILDAVQNRPHCH